VTRATLLADGGAAAASEDFFRSPPLLEAEGVTHTLAAGELFLPVIVREIPDSDRLDAVSPYGYPGATVASESPAPAPGDVDWSATGLVSLFVRDRIGRPPCFAGGTERSVVQVHDPARERGLRPRLGEQIRHNERAGWSVEATPGPEASDHQRAAFLALYTETMTRADAAPGYFYDAAYFERVLGFAGSWVLLAHSADGNIQAGGIAALSDGLLHYYLGGTADDALEDSPFKNVVAAMMDLADEREAPLNLGGGVVAGDGLERFKRGFANAELPFVTHEVVCDSAAYEELSAGRDAGDFFPAYRAPVSGED
jgi:hypothetical protein